MKNSKMIWYCLNGEIVRSSIKDYLIETNHPGLIDDPEALVKLHPGDPCYYVSFQDLVDIEFEGLLLDSNLVFAPDNILTSVSIPYKIERNFLILSRPVFANPVAQVFYDAQPLWVTPFEDLVVFDFHSIPGKLLQWLSEFSEYQKISDRQDGVNIDFFLRIAGEVQMVRATLGKICGVYVPNKMLWIY